jgi:hypothetical protein
MALALGRWTGRAGRVVVVGDAAAPISAELAHTYLAQGVTTLCCPALAPEGAHRLSESGVPGNVLVLGRIATASIGLNAFAARLRAEGLEVTALSGVIAG